MIDAIWEGKYKGGFNQRYPWDSVVSFVYRYAPKKDKAEVNVLEVGFGTGSNLWFAVREGFNVFGIEASETAVSFAKKRFEKERLAGDFHVGDFEQLPFDDDSMDLVVDRAALTHVGRTAHVNAIQEIARVLKTGGYFHYNVYADTHTSAHSGQEGDDGVIVNISKGTLVDVGQVYFPTKAAVESYFSTGWKIHRLEHREYKEVIGLTPTIHSEWLAIVEKCD